MSATFASKSATDEKAALLMRSLSHASGLPRVSASDVHQEKAERALGVHVIVRT